MDSRCAGVHFRRALACGRCGGARGRPVLTSVQYGPPLVTSAKAIAPTWRLGRCKYYYEGQRELPRRATKPRTVKRKCPRPPISLGGNSPSVCQIRLCGAKSVIPYPSRLPEGSFTNLRTAKRTHESYRPRPATAATARLRQPRNYLLLEEYRRHSV